MKHINALAVGSRLNYYNDITYLTFNSPDYS
jgi:hypothetical protein